jgi:hypothetical protein
MYILYFNLIFSEVTFNFWEGAGIFCETLIKFKEKKTRIPILHTSNRNNNLISDFCIRVKTFWLGGRDTSYNLTNRLSIAKTQTPRTHSHNTTKKMQL